MRFIPIKIHAVLDILGIICALSFPWIYHIQHHMAGWLMFALAGIQLIYSLLTRYGLGIYPLFSMRLHLILDLFSGAFLIIIPWLFDAPKQAHAPLLILGVVEMFIAFVSKIRPDEQQQ